MVRLCENRLQTETHIFLNRGEPCSQRPTEMAGNHEADATTQPCVGVKGIGQGRSIFYKCSSFVICALCLPFISLSLLPVSHDYGFGLMDAGAMVTMAKNWTRVPEQRLCAVDGLGGKSR